MRKNTEVEAGKGFGKGEGGRDSKWFAKQCNPIIPPSVNETLMMEACQCTPTGCLNLYSFFMRHHVEGEGL